MLYPHDFQPIPREPELHSRDCLKASFASGEQPTAKQFKELIDSNFNMNNEGYNKSAEYGFEVSTRGKSAGLLGFFRSPGEQLTVEPDQLASCQCQNPTQHPVWSIKLDQHGKQNLAFLSASAEEMQPDLPGYQTGTTPTNAPNPGSGPTLSLSPTGGVGVHRNAPGCELDINGALGCATRLGSGSLRPNGDTSAEAQDYAPIAADGEWHTITPAMTGAQALEIVAGVGKKGSGRYALLHAIALNTYNPKGWLFNFLGLKNRIRCQHSYYRSRNDKLALRWTGENRRYFLQIRSNGNYGLGPQGDPIGINYHITSLWTDPRMTQSWDIKPGGQQ